MPGAEHGGPLPADPAPSVHRLDGGGPSPGSLLLLRDHASRLAAGAVIHLTTTDPVAPIDLLAWCRMTGHLYLGPVPGPERPTYAVQVFGRPVPTQPDAPRRVARWTGSPDPVAATPARIAGAGSPSPCGSPG